MPGMASASPVRSGSRLAWHKITARRRHISCAIKRRSSNCASNLRSLPRCPSTSKLKRCSSGWAKPGASVLSRMYAPCLWWSLCEIWVPISCSWAAHCSLRSSRSALDSGCWVSSIENSCRATLLTRPAWALSTSKRLAKRATLAERRSVWS